jgi:hypothetical protein
LLAIIALVPTFVQKFQVARTESVEPADLIASPPPSLAATTGIWSI